MNRMLVRVVAAVFVSLGGAVAIAQSAKPAVYITDEDIKKVNALPGVDRQLRVVDIGSENLAVGIIHRGATRPAGAAAGNAARQGGGGQQAGESCGQAMANPPAGSASGIAHDSQTENYVIVSGGGTLVTGGHIVNGRNSGPDSEVTTTLNGPSCSGMIVGADVVKKVVKTGDVIVIPAGTPHGWTDITDHVDYLSIRPSDHVLKAGYVNPALK
jgi:mannose-6-phosphate isomerase-like protein (cupin superfamily)